MKIETIAQSYYLLKVMFCFVWLKSCLNRSNLIEKGKENSDPIKRNGTVLYLDKLTTINNMDPYYFAAQDWITDPNAISVP